MTLEEIKKEYAKELYFSSWDVFISDYSDAHPNWGDYGKSHPNLLDKHWDIVAKRYAEECVKASLEKASEDGKVIYKDYGIIGHWEVNKESITDESNIILL